ncbi:MAG: DUF1501 domain-containing protein [Gammaproteobacteria bacterium]|nr:MAG: DUF1501 domain-containing protein [Gammaproteobacteria bacterium]
MKITRRKFLKVSGLAAAVPLAGPRISLAFSGNKGSDRDILISVYQRGAADGLNIIVPYFDGRYYDLRPTLAVDPPGAPNGALDLDGSYGMHPTMTALRDIYDAGDLAVVHAAGSPHPSHSHFDAQDFMERGILEKIGAYTGWLGRYMELTSPFKADSPFRVLGMGTSVQITIRGNVAAIAMYDIDGFDLYAQEPEANAIRTALQALYPGDDLLDVSAQQTFAAVDLLAAANPLQYAPDNGAQYPETEFSRQLMQIGQMIKADVGLEVAAIDFNGWDHHDGELGILPSMLQEFSNALAAFNQDMGDRMNNITLTTTTEFGRRAYENGSVGTDHGHGGVMFAMGKNVNGGQVYVDWPGLQQQQLYEQGDLDVTTDFRLVLGELLDKRGGGTDLNYVFPDYQMPSFLGIFS